MPELAQRLKWAFGIALISALLMPLVMGKWTPLISFGLLMAFWVFAAMIYTTWSRLKLETGSLGTRIGKQSLSWWGMVVAHFGIGVFIFGVTLVNGYQTEHDVRMEIGDTVTVGHYVFTFRGVSPKTGPNYQASVGDIGITHKGKPAQSMHPEKRIYNVSGSSMTEAAIDSGFTRDLYVALGEPLENGAWSVRVYYKPFVDWIWGGSLLMALGGLLAVSDRRYRLARRAHKTEAAVVVGSQA